MSLFFASLLNPSHNLLVILLGVASLGVAAGLLGCFLLFRKRSLLSDTIGHSVLPGVALAFIISQQFDSTGKSLLALLLGGILFGWLSVQTVQWIIKNTLLREDAAMAIVLTLYYGLGVVLLSVIQSSATGNSSGLEYYLFGMVASMVQSEAHILLGSAFFAMLVIFLFFKELNLLCFDETFTRAQGFSRRWLDELLMLTTLIVAIVGLQTVGLLLIMALFIIPPATARLWTQSMPLTLLISASVGALGGLIGAIASATIPHLPAGAAIILATAALFGLSLLFGAQKGWLVRYYSYRQLETTLAENQFLRAAFDNLETQQQIRLLCGREFSRRLALVPFPLLQTLGGRQWSRQKVQSLATRLSRKGLLIFDKKEHAQLSEKGLDRAIEVAKTHRLTELYLLEHADVAPRNVHQYVEKIEEITTPDIAQDLRTIFQNKLEKELIPTEPHQKQPN